jgi:putative ABC transport system substrate-binding protein
LERLRELGWVDGRNIVVEDRVYGESIDRLPELAAELMRSGVDVFIVGGGADAVRVQKVTRSIPIVTWGAGDLVEMGLAASLVRPGGNVTGVQSLQPELAPKHLSLIKEAIPLLSRSAVLFHRYPSSTSVGSDAAIRREAEAGARALGIALQFATVSGADEFDGAFSSFKAGRAQAVTLVRDAFMASHLKTLAALGFKYRLPTISDMAALAPDGGLMSYGYSFRDSMRAAADVIDTILRGAKAEDIPIRQATIFRLVINLKTAKALGLTIPPSLLARADQVLE